MPRDRTVPEGQDSLPASPTQAPLAPLEPEIAAIFASLRGQPSLDTLERAPLVSPESATLAPLERVSLDVDGQRARYVVKRITRLGDWLSRATDDRLIREHQLAASGLFAALPAGVASATIASTSISQGAAIIMRDVSAGLMPPGDARVSPAQLHVSLNGLAAMHAQFAGFPDERAQRIGLNRLESWLTPLSPATARREATRHPRDPFTPLIDPGWAAFASLAPRAWDLIGPLLDDPRPLANALRRHTPTLVHGDAKAANFAIEDDALVLFDWSTTTVGPGALDLAWYLCINAHKLPCSKTEAIEVYRSARARLGVLPHAGDEWERELALALLTSPMRLGWLRAYSAVNAAGERSERDRREIEYWAGRALAARYLVHPD